MTDTPRYTTVTEVKLAMQKSLTDFDTPLAMIVCSVEDTIDRVCNRKDGFKAVTNAAARTFPGSGMPYQYVDDMAEAPTLVEVKDSPSDTTYVAWAATDWTAFTGAAKHPIFNPVNKPYTGLLVTPGGDHATFLSGVYRGVRGFRLDPDDVQYNTPTVRVTAKWGYAVTVPNPIRMATVAQALRWAKKAQGSWQKSMGSGEMGTLILDQDLDPDIKQMLIDGRFVRPALGME